MQQLLAALAVLMERVFNPFFDQGLKFIACEADAGSNLRLGVTGHCGPTCDAVTDP